MRRALGIAAALALAACQVDVEGAQCSQPGTSTECPDGQACGNDGRCSERAAACVAAGTLCVSTQAPRCRGTSAIERCDATADAVCGTWELEEDCGQLVCAGGPTPECVCAPASADLYVDPGAGGAGSETPTGAPEPPRCRLASIPEALALATEGTTVHVVGTPPTSYSGLPYRIRRGVSLVADDSPLSPGTRILSNAVAGPGIVLEEGSRLAGFTVRAAPGDPRPLGIQVDCAAADQVILSGVDVDAHSGATLLAGIAVGGACDVELQDVEVRGATGIGLEVALDSPAPVVQMTGGRLQGCQTGASLSAGDLRLQGTIVSQNTGTGVVAGDGEGDTHFSANDALFTGNADTALVAFTNGGNLDLQNNRFCGNQASTARGNASRLVGGIFFRGAPPAAGHLVFSGNEVHGNEAAQVFVTGTNTPWDLDGGGDLSACTSTRNLFLDYGDPILTGGRGLIADAPVNARWNAWQGITPSQFPAGASDYEWLLLTPSEMDLGVASDAFCQNEPVPRPCP